MDLIWTWCGLSRLNRMHCEIVEQSEVKTIPMAILIKNRISSRPSWVSYTDQDYELPEVHTDSAVIKVLIMGKVLRLSTTCSTFRPGGYSH